MSKIEDIEDFDIPDEIPDDARPFCEECGQEIVPPNYIAQKSTGIAENIYLCANCCAKEDNLPDDKEKAQEAYVLEQARDIDGIYKNYGFTTKEVDEYIEKECSKCTVNEADPFHCQFPESILECMKNEKEEDD